MNCCVCNKPAGGAHKCLKCNHTVHAICGKNPTGEEGYGVGIKCFNCTNIEVSDAVVLKSCATRKSAASEEKTAFLKLFNPDKGESDPKKRKLRRDVHFCLVCNQTISRGNNAARKRHHKNHHMQDISYNIVKNIVPYDHQLAAKARKSLATSPSSCKKLKLPLPNTTRSKPESSQHLPNHSSNQQVFTTPSTSESTQHLPSHSSNQQVFSNPSTSGSTQHLPSHSSKQQVIVDPTVHDCSSADVLQTTTNNITSDNTPTVQSILNFTDNDQNDSNLPQTSIDQINSKLNILISKLNTQTGPYNTTAIADLENPSSSLHVIKHAKCLHEIQGSDFRYYPNEAGGGIMRCELCFNMICENFPKTSSKSAQNAERLLRSVQATAGNTLASGVIISAERVEQLVEGKNQSWYNFKSMLIEHASCSSSRNGGTSHYRAVVWNNKRTKKRKLILNVVSNQLSAALSTIKIKSAATHYESLIGLLHSCGSEVGNIGHSRKQFTQMLNAFYGHCKLQLNSLLSSQLASTGLPPHFATASDKSTPGRVTNHAIMILVMVKGVKTAIPIDAPPVYKYVDGETEGGSAADLALQVINALKEIIPSQHLTHLVSHQADGQYQAAQFMHTLKREIYECHQSNPPPGDNLFFVVPWDVAHWMDCAFADIREKEDTMLQGFIKRANRFNAMFGRGRGHAEYHSIAESNKLLGRVVQIFATTRFISSSFDQFRSIYESYEALLTAYEQTRDTHDDCDETRYMIKGRDFCIDLCGILDCMSPVIEIMVRCQSINQCLWHIVKLWPRVKIILENMMVNLNEQLDDISSTNVLKHSLFPRLANHFHNLNCTSAKECTFKNISLLEGWSVTSTSFSSSVSGRNRIIQWTEREPVNCIKDLLKLCHCIVDNLHKRYLKSVPKAANILGQCFYIPDILATFEGSTSKMTATLQAKLKTDGLCEFSTFYTYVCGIPHIQKLYEDDPTLQLIDALSGEVYYRFKCILFEIVFLNLGNCRQSIFISKHGKLPSGRLLSLRVMRDADSISDDRYELVFEENLTKYEVTLNEPALFTAFYTNPDVYNKAGKEVCISLDVALGLGGSEAVVESFYSTMKTNHMSGGQLNDTLVKRTIVDWIYPGPINCPNTIREVAKLYLDGDKELNLPRHQPPIFVDSRGRSIGKYSHGSKVLDRLSTTTYSFVLADDDID